MQTRKPADGSDNAAMLGGHVLDLLHRASQAADTLFGERHGGSLTPRQFAVLAVVAGSKGLSQTQITEMTGIDRSTMADLVVRLMGRKLVRRSRSKTDNRVWIVRLGAEGADALRAAQRQARRTEKIILSGLESMRRQEFMEALRTLAFLADVH